MDPIVKVSFSLQDKAPERASFGIPLIAGYHTRFPERIREYGSADDMLLDGFTAADPEHKAAVKLKGQTPSPARFKVGRLASATFTHTVTLTPLLTTEGLVYSGKINGESFSATVQSGDVIDDIVDDLVADITGIAGVTATDDTTHVTLTGSSNKTLEITDYGAGSNVDYTATAIADTTTVNASNLAADLAAINASDSDWYGLYLAIPNSPDAIDAAAAWSEANGKNFFPESPDAAVINPGSTTDIAAESLAKSYTRTAGIWHPDIGIGVGAAWMAVNLSSDAGSYTPAFKSLAGVRTVKLSQAAITALQAKNWTRYTRDYAQNITYEGKTPSGRFIDVVRFVDWQIYTIKADWHAYAANSAKIGYGTPGITATKGVIEGSLKKGIIAGGLDGVDVLPVVTVPTLDETDVGDRAARVLRNIRVNGRLTGALHGLDIQFDISV